MLLELSKITFNNDFFTLSTKDGGEITLYNVDENIDGLETKGIIILFKNSLKGIEVRCSPIIGMGNEYLKIVSYDKELNGKMLQKEHFTSCFIEIFEEDEDM